MLNKALTYKKNRHLALSTNIFGKENIDEKSLETDWL